MDLVDIANETEISLTEHRINVNRTRTMKTHILYCITCGILIPEERRNIMPGAIRCVDCQQSYEFNERVVYNINKVLRSGE